MRDLFIVGAGGFGREVVWIVERINAVSPQWHVVGFADDAPEKASGNFEGYPILGSCEKTSHDFPGASVCIAIGSGAVREKVASTLRGHDFPAIVDPSAQVFPTAELHRGVFVGPQAVVSAGAELSRFAVVNARAGVGHDCVVGAFADICPGVSLSGHTVVGERAMMGTNSCTAPGMKVGKDAVVACGTPVLRDVPDGATLSPFGMLKS